MVGEGDLCCQIDLCLLKQHAQAHHPYYVVYTTSPTLTRWWAWACCLTSGCCSIQFHWVPTSVSLFHESETKNTQTPGKSRAVTWTQLGNPALQGFSVLLHGAVTPVTPNSSALLSLSCTSMSKPCRISSQCGKGRVFAHGFETGNSRSTSLLTRLKIPLFQDQSIFQTQFFLLLLELPHKAR